MHEHEKQDDHAREADDRKNVEDLDVPESENEDVKGGAEPVHNYSFKQAWPKKYT